MSSRTICSRLTTSRALRGQQAPEVKACLLYGADNPIDGIVLDVLLRKVREIKRSTGINVPFPEDSQSIIDTITQSLLLNPREHIDDGGGRLARCAPPPQPKPSRMRATTVPIVPVPTMPAVRPCRAS